MRTAKPVERSLAFQTAQGRGRWIEFTVLLLVGAAAFGAGAILAAITPNARTLVTSRPLHRTVAATFAPSASSLLCNLFPDPKQRTCAISVLTSSFLIGASLGPQLGAALLD